VRHSHGRSQGRVFPRLVDAGPIHGAAGPGNALDTRRVKPLDTRPL
jgi:hypothetical protein